MKPPSRITFLTNSLCAGGAEKHTIQLFNNLRHDGFQVSLGYLKRDECLLPELNSTIGEIWCADFGKGFDLLGLRRLAKWIQRTKPSMLVCVNLYSLLFGHLALRLSGHTCKIIELFHSTILSKAENWKMNLIYRRLLNRSDHIVYVSEEQRIYWESRGLRKDLGFTIHNGIDLEHFSDHYGSAQMKNSLNGYSLKLADFTVGICAALRPEKRHEDLLEAVALLKNEGIEISCMIIGNGPERARIEAKIRQLSLESDVLMTGFQRDVRPFVAACSCMAIVSDSETFSISALESMAMGKPMIMSETGGAVEQVRNGVNGYLFPPRDVQSLASALRKVQPPAHRRNLGVAARNEVEKEFTEERMLESYHQLFVRLRAQI